MKTKPATRKKKALPKKSEEELEVERRADWEHNHQIVFDAFVKLANTKKKYPTLKEIATETGMSIMGVSRHMDEMDFEEMRKKYSVFTEAAMFQLATKAAKGTSIQWTELYFKVVHNLGQKKEMDVTLKGGGWDGFKLEKGE